MPRNRMNLGWAAILVLLASAACRGGEPQPIELSTQLVVVTTASWDAVAGTLQRFQRVGSGKKWQPAGDAVSVVVGKNGLGWGVGIVAIEVLPSHGGEAADSDPIKQEGDGKAPAGIFRLSRIFGYAEQKPAEWKMPYLRLTPNVECVDDPASKFYNRVLDRNEVTADWNSSEKMLRSDELYRWGIIVDHNADPPRAGEGSCIFLHIWRGPGQGTVGCTAMPQNQLEMILDWLDPKRNPVLVQLPQAEYEWLRRKWKMPELAISR